MTKAFSFGDGADCPRVRLGERLAAIDEGIMAADDGFVVDHRLVVAWVASWGTPSETPLPLARKSDEG